MACIDVLLGGKSHDLRDPGVTASLAAIAAHPNCTAIMASLPCATWSAIRFNNIGPHGPPPLRTLAHPLGIPSGKGDLRPEVVEANAVAENGMHIIEAGLRHKVRVIIESPVGRGAGSPFSLPGRGNHASFWTHPAVINLMRKYGYSSICFDQCCTGALAVKSTQLWCSPNVLPEVAKRFAHLICNHAKCRQRTLLNQRTTASTNTFKSKLTEHYTSHMCRLLAEALTAHLAPVTLPCLTTCLRNAGTDAVSAIAPLNMTRVADALAEVKVPAPLVCKPGSGGRLGPFLSPTTMVAVRDGVLKEPAKVVAALASLASPGASYTNIDSAGPNTEFSGGEGFFGAPLPCKVDLTTGTEDKTRVTSKYSHRQYFLTDKGKIFCDVRNGVFDCRGTKFQRDLWSPHDAIDRGMSILFTKQAGKSVCIILLPDGDTVTTKYTQGYYAERYLSRQDAERALANRPPHRPHQEPNGPHAFPLDSHLCSLVNALPYPRLGTNVGLERLRQGLPLQPQPLSTAPMPSMGSLWPGSPHTNCPCEPTVIEDPCLLHRSVTRQRVSNSNGYKCAHPSPIAKSTRRVTFPFNNVNKSVDKGFNDICKNNFSLHLGPAYYDKTRCESGLCASEPLNTLAVEALATGCMADAAEPLPNTMTSDASSDTRSLAQQVSDAARLWHRRLAHRSIT